MNDSSLQAAISTLPPGKWAVAFSGGADSTALFHLLRARSDLQLVVAHVNHQTRGADSEADEAFVRSLCERANIACRIARRDALEAACRDLPVNPSARFRALRFQHFRDVVEREYLRGVILAHHADDQAETVFQRLLRGAGYSSLAGIAPTARVNGVQVVRPLLEVRRDALRKFLLDRNLSWREDASNISPKYLRNRLRVILRDRDELTESLIHLSRACANLKSWASQNSLRLAEKFSARELDDLPAILARTSAGAWLRCCGVAADAIDRTGIDRLRTMCADAASPARQQFPGGVLVRRRGGIISAG